MRSDQHMTIGVVARRSGVRVRNLRFYEEQGLITPLGRTAKGYRVYGPPTLKDLAFLKAAKRLGLHLDQIGELLRVRRQGQCSCAPTREFVEARLEQVDEALRELTDLRNEMRRTLRSWEAEANGTARSPCRSIGSEIPSGA